jgi:hypothetical protein
MPEERLKDMTLMVKEKIERFIGKYLCSNPRTKGGYFEIIFDNHDSGLCTCLSGKFPLPSPFHWLSPILLSV